jgi:tetratricopeptide (TPR) repeat protein
MNIDDKIFVLDSILNLESIVKKNIYDMKSWKLLLSYALNAELERDILISRRIFEFFLQIFPSAGKIWYCYIYMENKNKTDKVESLFLRALPQCIYLPLWKYYFDFLGSVSISRYETALRQVGLDIGSVGLWLEYIQYLKQNTDQYSIDLTRKTFQRAINTPLLFGDLVLENYQQWERELDRNNSSLILNEWELKHKQSDVLLKKRIFISKHIHFHALPQPPNGSIHERHQLSLWKELIALEESNPLDSDATTVRARVSFTYRQALQPLLYFPSVWLSYGRFLVKCGNMEDANNVYTRAIDIIPHSSLLYYTYIDFLETYRSSDQVKEIYMKLVALHSGEMDSHILCLKGSSSSSSFSSSAIFSLSSFHSSLSSLILAYIWFIKYIHKSEGKENARDLFVAVLDSLKKFGFGGLPLNKVDPQEKHQPVSIIHNLFNSYGTKRILSKLFLSMTEMECVVNMDRASAAAIYELGMEKYELYDVAEYVLDYVRFLIDGGVAQERINETIAGNYDEIRRVFERILAVPVINEKVKVGVKKRKKINVVENEVKEKSMEKEKNEPGNEARIITTSLSSSTSFVFNPSDTHRFSLSLHDIFSAYISFEMETANSFERARLIEQRYAATFPYLGDMFLSRSADGAAKNVVPLSYGMRLMRRYSWRGLTVCSEEEGLEMVGDRASGDEEWDDDVDAYKKRQEEDDGLRDNSEGVLVNNYLSVSSGGGNAMSGFGEGNVDFSLLSNKDTDMLEQLLCSMNATGSSSTTSKPSASGAVAPALPTTPMPTPFAVSMLTPKAIISRKRTMSYPLRTSLCVYESGMFTALTPLVEHMRMTIQDRANEDEGERKESEKKKKDKEVPLSKYYIHPPPIRSSLSGARFHLNVPPRVVTDSLMSILTNTGVLAYNFLNLLLTINTRIVIYRDDASVSLVSGCHVLPPQHLHAGPCPVCERQEC